MPRLLLFGMHYKNIMTFMINPKQGARTLLQLLFLRRKVFLQRISVCKHTEKFPSCKQLFKEITLFPCSMRGIHFFTGHLFPTRDKWISHYYFVALVRSLDIMLSFAFYSTLVTLILNITFTICTMQVYSTHDSHPIKYQLSKQSIQME